MEPFSMMFMMGAGLGMQAIGGLLGHSASEEYNQAQKQQIGLEQKVEAQRKDSMELDARRRSLENLRNVQRARSMALNSATSQGAQFGSGLQAGYSQISAQGSWNQAGISQNQAIGENIFGLNEQMSQNKITMANANMDLQTSQGLSSFGSSLIGAARPFGQIFSGYSNGTPSPNYSNR